MAKSSIQRVCAKDRRRLRILQRQYQKLRRKLAQTGYLAQGTLTESSLRCGNPGCRCHRDLRRRHGPYVYWTTKVKGRTVSRLLKPQEARLYKEWARNRRRLSEVINQMMEVSRDVAAVLLGGEDPFIPGR